MSSQSYHLSNNSDQASWQDMQQDIHQFVEHEKQSLSKEQQSKLSKMKREMGFFFVDETMNLFKLKLYNWNVNEAKKYYKNDKFCLDYCIGRNFKYGCNKKQCPYAHSINLTDLVYGNLQHQRDYKQAELLCLYLMYKNVYNDNNSTLFNVYAFILYRTGKSKQDYLSSEKYYLKSLAIDNNNYNAHANYALLLANELNNYDKVECHFNQALTIRPNNGITHINFASFLIEKRHKYQLALSHCEKACKLKPNLSAVHYHKAQSLYGLNKFDKSLTEYETSLQLNEKDGFLYPDQVENAKKQIELLANTQSCTIKQDDQSRAQTTKCEQSQNENENEDEKKSSETIAVDQNVFEFGNLSMIEQIDEIMAEIIQLEQIIDDNDDNDDKNQLQQNVKRHLASVRNKLERTQTAPTSRDEITDLASQLQKLTEQKNSGREESSLSLLRDCKKLEQETKMRKQKIDTDFTKLLDDIQSFWNNLGGSNAIDSFEKKWFDWSVDDTLQWFEFVLSTKTIDMNGGDDYEIEHYSSSDSSDDEDDDEDDDEEEVDDEKKQEMIEFIDFKRVRSYLSGLGFNAKKDLPILVKAFQFERFGFNNKKDCKLLCQKTKRLVKKYPKKK